MASSHFFFFRLSYSFFFYCSQVEVTKKNSLIFQTFSQVQFSFDYVTSFDVLRSLQTYLAVFFFFERVCAAHV